MVAVSVNGIQMIKINKNTPKVKTLSCPFEKKSFLLNNINLNMICPGQCKTIHHHIVVVVVVVFASCHWVFCLSWHWWVVIWGKDKGIKKACRFKQKASWPLLYSRAKKQFFSFCSWVTERTGGRPVLMLPPFKLHSSRQTEGAMGRKLVASVCSIICWIVQETDSLLPPRLLFSNICIHKTHWQRTNNFKQSLEHKERSLKWVVLQAVLS